MWIAFVGYATLFAPADRGNTAALIMNALLMDTDKVDAGVIAVFNLLGVVPALYASLLLADGAGRRVPAWPFVIGSCFLGAFALVPYLALREDDGRFLGERRGFVRFFDSRVVGIGLLLSTLSLVGFGLMRGELTRYRALFETEALVHVMTIDFILLTVLFPTVLASDMARRGLQNRRLFSLISCIPLFGPAFYVALRPALSETTR